MLIRSEEVLRPFLGGVANLVEQLTTAARVSASEVGSAGTVAKAAADALQGVDKRFRVESGDSGSGQPPSAGPAPVSGDPPERFYNGARLWQLDQVFPKAFARDAATTEPGYIRTASHSTAGDVVYLTDGDDIAGVYGTITSWTDVRDGAMRFHPAGMVLGVDAGRIRADRMAADGHSARDYIEGVSDRVLTTPGRVHTSDIVSVQFQTYDSIIADPDVTLVADGFPGFEGLPSEALRDPAVVTDRLDRLASAVRRHYPSIDVSVGSNPLSGDEAIRTFLAT